VFKSSNPISEGARTKIASALNACLVDGLDLKSQIKVAHWNVKGPHFAALHPLFETFAVTLDGFTDSIAERAVALGALAVGTARDVAKTSRIPEYASKTTAGLEHVALLADRIDVFLGGLRAARSAAEKEGDADTVDLLTGMVTEFEKNGWFLRASLEGI
jgi:starvation-inducible DNA-binding protein